MEKIYEFHRECLSGNVPVIYHYDKARARVCYYNWHSNIELLLVKHGRGEAVLGGENFSISEGNVVIINSNVPHSVITDDEIQYHCLIPDSEFCKENGIDTSTLSYTSVVRSEQLSALYEAFVSAYNSDGKYREAKIKSTLLSLLVYISEKYSSQNFAECNKRDEIMEAIKLAIAYIESHFSESITLDMLAREAGLSKYYFTRQFKEITGITPFSYITSVRISNAKKLLRRSDIQIREAARASGFGNDSYFSKTFKEYTGMLPIEYSKKQHNVNFEQY